MIRLFLACFLLLASVAFPLDHLYSVRAGLGMSNLIGSDAPKGVKMGLAGSIGAVGAQAFYASGPLWGTELSLNYNQISRDTSVWDDQDGDYTDKVSMDQSFTRLSFGLFLMKSWDFGLNISAGPQVSYLANCIKTVEGKEESCSDSYQIYQLDGQLDAMFFIMEPLAIDVKYVQTLLPSDEDGEEQSLLSTVSIGLYYIF
jgi:hypothetical protein